MSNVETNFDSNESVIVVQKTPDNVAKHMYVYTYDGNLSIRETIDNEKSEVNVTLEKLLEAVLFIVRATA